MTVDGHILLKMLEPALRPGSMGSAGNVGKAGQFGQGGEVRPGTPPLEQQSFESLLAGQLQANSQQVGSTDEVFKSSGVADSQAASRSQNSKLGHGPLGQLARIDQIENTSLRSLMSSTAAQKAGNDVSQAQNQTGDVNDDDFAIDRTLHEFLASE